VCSISTAGGGCARDHARASGYGLSFGNRYGSIVVMRLDVVQPLPQLNAKDRRHRGGHLFVFPNDHPPPHVHVRFQGVAVRLRITDGVLLDAAPAFPPRVLRDVRTWLLRHRDVAAEAWTTYHP
jgi:Domain of unknown function (DUF4160)